LPRTAPRSHRAPASNCPARPLRAAPPFPFVAVAGSPSRPPPNGQNPRHSISPNEFIAKSFAVRLDMARGRMREMDRQHEAPGPGDFTEQAPARARRLVRIPIEDRRPARLAALQSVVHKIADDDRVLPARADIDAAMARRMPWRRRQPERVVEREIVVDQQSLAGRDHRLAIKSPDIAAAAGAGLAALGRILPGGVFAFVEYVFCLRKRRHP